MSKIFGSFPFLKVTGNLLKSVICFVFVKLLLNVQYMFNDCVQQW